MNNNEVVPPKFLPLGTVCRLKGGQKNVMISGYGAVNSTENKIYDYMGILFPEGQITSDYSLIFDHDNIDHIESMGYSNDESKKYLESLEKYMNVAANDIMKAMQEVEDERGVAVTNDIVYGNKNETPDNSNTSHISNDSIVEPTNQTINADMLN